ncbi:MAG: amidohydrolase family protein, partial [Planctomycetota bacterium]
MNPAEYFGLKDRGAIAPGRRADLVVVDDLDALMVRDVWCGGRLAASAGAPLAWSLDAPPAPPPPAMHVDLELAAFRIPAREGNVRVIEAIPDQIVTGRLEVLP